MPPYRHRNPLPRPPPPGRHSIIIRCPLSPPTHPARPAPAGIRPCCPILDCGLGIMTPTAAVPKLTTRPRRRRDDDVRMPECPSNAHRSPGSSSVSSAA